MLEIVGRDKVREIYHSFVGFNNLRNVDMVWKVSLELKQLSSLGGQKLSLDRMVGRKLNLGSQNIWFKFYPAIYLPVPLSLLALISLSENWGKNK